MKLISIKKILVKINGRKKLLKNSVKVTWICSLLKKISSTICPQGPQAQQLQLAPQSELALAETKFRKSLKNPFKLFLRHLNIEKLKTVCENEDQVVQYCTQYLNKFPSSYNTTCDRAEAINDLDYAIALKPYKSIEWCLRGMIRELEKSYIDTLGDLNNALSTNCLALKWRAFCNYILKSYDQSLWNLHMVIILGYTDAFTSYINRADINRELKDFEEASKDPDIDFKFDNKALAYESRNVINGKYRAAVDDLTKESELQPNDAMFLRNRSGAYRILIYPEEALEDLEKSCLPEPENEYQYGLRRAKYDSLKNLKKVIGAKLYCKSRKYDFATDDVNQAEPKNVIAHQQLAGPYRRKCHKALIEISLALSLDPNNIVTLLLRADIYFLLERYKKPFMDINKYLKVRFKSLELREGILNDIKKRNLEQEAVSKSPKSSALISEATPNFGDIDEEGVNNNRKNNKTKMLTSITSTTTSTSNNETQF